MSAKQQAAPLRLVAIWFALGVSIWVAAPVRAQELYLLGGATRSSGEPTYGWAIEYWQGLDEHFAFSLGWLNEGHVPNHHRDGHSAQLWTRANVFDRRLSLAAGIGPYRYFDTTAAEAGASYANAHGWGAIASLAATWYTDSRWLVQLRANRIRASGSIDSNQLLLGVGYQLEPAATPGPRPEPSPRFGLTTRNELTAFLGRTIVNSFQSELSTAKSIEYRRGLTPHLEASVAWLNEGDTRLIRRNGVTAQIWAVSAFFDDRLALGVGVGPYVALNKYREPQGSEAEQERVAGIVTFSASYRFDSRWAARVSWNRIVTDYSRDADVILAGVGYRF